MDSRVVIRRSVVVERPQSAVFAYVSDFGRAPEWREEVVEATQTPPGPMVPGTRLRETARVMGRPVVTDSVVDTVDPGHRFTFRHVAGPLPVSGAWAVTAEGEHRSRVDYELRIELRGWWALLAPVVRASGPKQTARSLGTLRARLERAPVG